jgi:TonB family protein
MSKKSSSFILLALLLTVPALVAGQEPQQPDGIVMSSVMTEDMKWETFGDGEGEFHARLPESPSVFSTFRSIKGGRAFERARIFGAYKEGVAYIIVVYDKPHQGETLDYFVNDFKSRFLSKWSVKFEHNASVNTDTGEQYSLKKDGVRGAARFFIKPKHAYVIMTAGASLDDDAAERFLDSLALWSFSLDKMKAPAPTEAANASLLGPSASQNVPPDKAGDPDAQYLFSGVKKIVPPDSDGDQMMQEDAMVSASVPESNTSTANVKTPNRIVEENEVTAAAFIVLRPEPNYTEEARSNRVEGVVKLRGVLNSSGKVTGVSVLEGLSHGLTEKAVEAFRHLVFLPARKDGKPVSQWITMEYDFSLN